MMNKNYFVLEHFILSKNGAKYGEISSQYILKII
jgi:hypothetical protein